MLPHILSPKKSLGFILIALFSLLIAPTATFPQTAVPPSGDGTQASPYLIAELGNLVWMSNNVSTSFGKYYTMTADIDASPTATWNDSGTDTSVLEGFKPIGTHAPDSGFYGNFDGAGHTITGLVINRPDTDYVGLFGYVYSDCKVRNVGLIDGNVIGHWCVGALVGQNWDGMVSNAYATGSVTGNHDVGGLVGWNYGTVSDVIFTGIVSGNYQIGGLVGLNQRVVLNAYAFGEVGGAGQQEVGGLIGENFDHSFVKNAYAAVSVSGNVRVGGLVGANFNSSTIACSYATGAVTGDLDSSGYVGGLVGENSGTVIDTYSTGGVRGRDEVGGLVGFNSGTVSNSYASGATTITQGYWGQNYGGLIGSNLGTVANSYWDIQTSGLATSAGGVGKTTDEMKHQITFADWDFTIVWTITENTTYPCLNIPEVVIAPLGDGTQESPYLISKLSHLVWMSEYTSNSSGKYYRMTADIDASSTATWNDNGTDGSVLEGFKPIGTYSNPDTTSFRGIFDGGGHTITGLTVNRSSANSIGLFGVIGSGSVVKNMGLTGGSVKGSSGIGSLIGLNNNGTVSDSYANETNVTGTSYYVGGLIGVNIGTVENVHASGSVTTSSHTVGGLVGLNNGGTMTKVYASGPVSGIQGVGGLVGQNTNSGVISNAYATGTVTATTRESYAGGLIGNNFMGTVTNAYATGSVTGIWCVGGLIGAGSNPVYAPVQSSYWDTQTSGLTTSAGGTGKTTEKIKQQATFVNWDFNTIWVINEGVTYPLLRSLLLAGDANADRAIDVGDLGILAANYGGSGKGWFQGDFNNDGKVDVGDLGILAAHYGTGSSSGSSFSTDNVGAFETTNKEKAGSDVNETTDTSCLSLGLPLILGLAFIGLMTIKPE